MSNSVTQDMMANAIRALAIDGVEAAKSGHPGMPMGAADMATALWTRVLKFDAADPHWPDRDRFVLSAGHGSMLLYSLLHLTGYPGSWTSTQLKNFRQLGSKTRGAPRIRPCARHRDDDGPPRPGASRWRSAWRWPSGICRRRGFGHDIVDHHTYVICGRRLT